MSKHTLAALLASLLVCGGALAQGPSAAPPPDGRPRHGQMAAGGGMPCCAWQSQAPREVIDQINRLAREYERAWNAHDAAKIASLFAEDATYLGAAGQSANGKNEIERLVEQEHQGPLKSSTVSISLRSIRALSPTLVVVDAHTEVSGIQPQAGMQIPERMHVTSVGEKVGGQWKIKALRAAAAPMAPPQGVGGAGGAGVDRKR